MNDAQRAQILDELRAVWAEEDAKRNDPGTRLVVSKLTMSDDWRIRKIAATYDRGIITFGEFEEKIREVLA